MKSIKFISRSFGVALVVVILGLSSCKRDDNVTTPIQQATNIKELKASPTFDWSTHKDVAFNVTGLPVNFDVKRKLEVKGADGTQYFNLFHNMKDDLNTTINLPIHVDKVMVEFGSIKKEIELMGNTINFTFAQDIPNELD